MRLCSRKRRKGWEKSIVHVKNHNTEKGEHDVGGESDQEHKNGGSESEAGSDEDEVKFPPIDQSRNTVPVAGPSTLPSKTAPDPGQVLC